MVTLPLTDNMRRLGILQFFDGNAFTFPGGAFMIADYTTHSLVVESENWCQHKDELELSGVRFRNELQESKQYAKQFRRKFFDMPIPRDLKRTSPKITTRDLSWAGHVLLYIHSRIRHDDPDVDVFLNTVTDGGYFFSHRWEDAGPVILSKGEVYPDEACLYSLVLSHYLKNR